MGEQSEILPGGAIALVKPTSGVDSPDGLAKWRANGVTDDNLVYACDDFVVFLRKNLDTDWITADSYNQKLDDISKNPDWGFVTRNVARLEAIPIDHLSAEHRRGFRYQVGTAVSLGLQADFSNAKALLQIADEFVTKRNNEVARRWFLESTGCTALLMILVPSLWGYFGRVSEAATLTTLEKASFCAAAGAIGAFLSVIFRISKVSLDPAAGRYIHYLEGASRVVAGAIAGPFLLFAVKLGIFLPVLDKSGIEAIAMIGLLAGASERLVPSLIGNMESQSVKPEK